MSGAQAERSGYSDDGYILPSLTVSPLWVASDYPRRVAFTKLEGIQAALPCAGTPQRVEAAAELVNGDAQPCIVWCGLNDESNALAAAIPDAVVVEGSMSPTEKPRG